MTQRGPAEFTPPPECPVFEPSWEEFADPFAFINKIRPIAEKTGICKVRPPPDWQPPFACDVDRLHFTPRIQRLNELEAQTRVKLNFLDQIAKFWELQGCTLKIPHVERKILDLYQLNRLVAEEGGFDLVCRERRWTKIAMTMGFAPGKAVGSHLRAHYERVLYPYHLFHSGTNLLVSLTYKCIRSIYHKLCIKLSAVMLEVWFRSQVTDGDVICARLSTTLTKKNNVTNRSIEDAVIGVDLYVCLVCGKGNDEDRLLLCDGCDDSYHTFCLIPPLSDVPKGDWRCPKCLAQECSKPQEAFGFEQACRDYSLKSFGEMADSFKSDYFNMPVHMVPTELVEKEFWRLVGTIEEDVTVEYGADIASKEFGSGFPIKGGKFKVAPHDEKYLQCGWNLNNMAMMTPSVLTHITADICGMTLPWLYVGMCFSSFCWHIEDHWSYSINYLHWGEPKTWYGAPGFAAEQLEAVMKKLAPELFESQPDLLHQLVTIMNPNTLMAHGVPIYRTNQCAGEFVITFPRSYHSGFNQGFNFAEAVNFCTVDWMPLGRQCVDHYRQLHRYCVFSHDEMVCNMAMKAGSLDVVLASAVQKDMRLMIKEERELRDKVRKMGVVQCELFEYDLLADDERQCVKCRTTCYLSALTCPCRPGVQVCLHHAHDLCSCPVSNYTLNYRFTLDDLYPMMNAVQQRAESYDEWAARVTEVMESDEKSFPENDLLRQLRLVTQDAEKCSSVAQRLLNGKRQTRYRTGGGNSPNQLTVEEMRSFVRQLYNLPCSLTQAPLLKDLLNSIEDFQQHSEKLLFDEVSADSVSEIESLLEEGSQFDVFLPELPLLRERLEQTRWLTGVQQAEDPVSNPCGLSLDSMRRLIDRGVGLTPHPSTERTMARLQELLTISEEMEEKAQALLKARPPESLETLSSMLTQIDGVPAYLPNCLLLQDTVNRAKEWLQEAEDLQVEYSSTAHAIPVRLEPLDQLEVLVSEVQAWKESAAKTFLIKNSPFTLFEVLCPRWEVGSSLKKKMRKVKGECVSSGKKKLVKLDSMSDVERALSDSKDSASAVRLKEQESLCSLRAANESKLLPTADCAALRVCVCQKPPMGAMLQCELCRDAFHSVCVRGPSDPLDPEAWLCPLCLRSTKPSLDKIQTLLSSLQRIRVRLPEGDALRYMIERAGSWQRRAREVIDSYDHSLTSQDCRRASPTLSHRTTGHKRKVRHYITDCYCIYVPGLSSELEELMVEGLLLQVSLPEAQQLYRLLLSGPPTTNTSHTEHAPYLTPEHSSPQREARTKRRMNREETEIRDRGIKPKSKKQRMGTEKRRERKEASVSASDVSQSEDSEEDMTQCPCIDHVYWVQCDCCNRWFHMICVGVSAELAAKEDYMCVTCSTTNAGRRK
uniref:[histone H3]-trimethyl-L-lysine(4) demethylase n=1 Tax=Cyprinus carpio TaxID=7962 RepID=A0A8C1IS19_CYPCA